MKKLIAFLLIAGMMLSLVSACSSNNGADTPPVSNEATDTTANAETKESTSEVTPENGLDPVTTKEISLTFSQWGLAEKGENEILNLRMENFRKKFPNIKIEHVAIDQATWNDALMTMASSGTLPDVFGVFSVTDAVAWEWALEVSEFFEKDPDTKAIYPAIAKTNLINGKRFSMPWVMFPHIMFINKTLFEKYNEPLPSYDWTWDDFKAIAERITHPEDFNFGTSNPLYQDLYPAAFNGNQGKWGWDGTAYHFDDVWVEAYSQFLDWRDADVLEWESAEDKEKWLGDPAAWPPGWGRSAMHIDWPWNIAGFEDTFSVQSGCEFLYYPIPAGPTKQQLVIVDNCVISSTTEHPREAWELQKYMFWGKEAAKQIVPGYSSVGGRVSRLPVIKDKEVWDTIIGSTDREDMKAYYAHLTDIVPSNWPIAPGWADIDKWIAENKIWDQLNNREITPAEIAPELEKKANEFAQAWIDKYAK